MKHLVSILFHRNSDQLRRLVKSLLHEDNVIIIHVCKNYKQLSLEELKVKFDEFDNVYFTEERVRATWATYKIYEAFHLCLKFAFSNNISFDYVSVISGQDYPIRPQSQLLEFLERNKGKEFLNYWDLSPPDGKSEYFHPIVQQNTTIRQKWRYQMYYFNFFKNITIKIPSHPENDNLNLKKHIKNSLKKLLKKVVPPRQFLDGLKPYSGSNWMTISFDASRYLYDFYEENKKFRKFMRLVESASEMIPHTILLNSSFSKRVENRNLRLIPWPDSNSIHPHWISKEHLPTIKNSSSDQFFVRKVSYSKDREIFNELDIKLKRHSIKV